MCVCIFPKAQQTEAGQIPRRVEWIGLDCESTVAGVEKIIFRGLTNLRLRNCYLRFTNLNHNSDVVSKTE